MTPAKGVLYVITSGTSAAPGVYDFIHDVLNDGWDVCAIPTPMGASFLDIERLETLTGHAVRSTFKHPTEPDVLPPADAFVVAPASFNTVNKIANGICDTLGVGVVCEAIGYGKPVILAPWFNRALARNSAYARSMQYLRGDGVHLVLTARTEPGPSVVDPDSSFPWADVLEAVREATAQIARGNRK